MIWTIPDKNKVVLYVAALCKFYGLQRAFLVCEGGLLAVSGVRVPCGLKI
jgi:hypothetical protein